MFNLTKAEVVGLDIGSSAVKVVQLHKDDAGYTASAVGIVDIPTSEDSEDNREINTIAAIRECFESAGNNTEFAVCGVSGQEVAVRDFQFPLLSNEEVEPAVLLEASQVCPFNAADSAVDYHLISNADNQTKGILIAATNSLIDNKVKLAKEADLKCALMDIDGLALLNCFNALADESEKFTAAILNVGGSYTTVAIIGENGWPFIRDMNFAGDDIIKQISAEKSKPKKSVKEILFGDSTAAQTELHDSMEKACQKLIIDVTKTLRYYAAQEQSTPVEKIFVCGGFSLAKGFVELLNTQLGVETLLWNPFEKIRCEQSGQYKDIFDKKGPALAVATGLAMRSI